MWKLLRLVAGLLILHAPGVAAARPLESFTLGGWAIEAHASDSTGAFLACDAITSYASGILMVISIDRNFGWSMNFADPAWNLAVGRKINILYWVDDASPIRATATAVSRNAATIPLPDNVSLFQQFRRGYVLNVFAEGQQFRFRLDGSARALNAVLLCAQRHTSLAASDARQAPAGPQDWSGSPAGSASGEATTLIANLLSAAGVTGFYILPHAQIPPHLANYDAVWGAPGVLGAVMVVRPDAGVEMSAIAAALIAEDARSCKGRFASGLEQTNSPDQAVASRFFTACEQKADSAYAHYTVFHRASGGAYVIGVVGRGSDQAESESHADRVDRLLRASYASMRAN